MSDFTTIATLVIPSVASGIAVLWSWGRTQFDSLKAQITQQEKEREDLLQRLAAVEAALVGDFPSWLRSQDGVILSVSPRFVSLFLAPKGLKASDIIGKSFTDLEEFANIAPIVDEMAQEVHLTGYAVRSGVQISPEIVVVLAKTVIPGPDSVTYRAIAIPTFDHRRSPPPPDMPLLPLAPI